MCLEEKIRFIALHEAACIVLSWVHQLVVKHFELSLSSKAQLKMPLSVS